MRNPATTTTSRPRDAADFNGDGYIDGHDLRQLCDQYGRTGSGLLWDLNGNGVVDIYDLSILMSRWAPGPGSPTDTTCN